jgi:predicted 2-oxoglutarate/Fe(II)-dependent dioxygenase YbiX
MSKRLQVLVEEDELREIRKVARARRMTVAEWVRAAIREARRREPAAPVERRLAVVRARYVALARRDAFDRYPGITRLTGSSHDGRAPWSSGAVDDERRAGAALENGAAAPDWRER